MSGLSAFSRLPALGRLLVPLGLLTAMSGATLAAIEGAAVTIGQKNRVFSHKHVVLRRGAAIRFTNEDEFLHQIYVRSPGFRFDSDEQKPGQPVEVAFPVPGLHEVRCGIHPKMLLKVEVE